jgi:phage shock protein A
MRETELRIALKRSDVQLEQLRAQLKHSVERIAKLETDVASLRAKTGSVEAGNMPKEPELPKPVDPPVPE